MREDVLIERVAYYYQDRMARRVAARFMFESALHGELITRMSSLIANFTPEAARKTASFLQESFRFDVVKTPQGQRDLKDYVAQLHSALDRQVESDIRSIWAKVAAQSGDLVRYFSSDGERIIPKEVQAGGNTYLNLAGFDQKKLGQFVTSLEAVFDSLKGWRRKALQGGVRVAFTRTGSSHYRPEDDTLYVRALPTTLRRASSYGSGDFILVHELGRRYAFKEDVEGMFSSADWYTTPLSSHAGRTFGELFALSNFGLLGPWDQTLMRFESTMTPLRAA